MTVADLGEHALLSRLLARLPRPGAQILVGPGDDAAVIQPGPRTRLVVTTDALVEHVHFSRTWSRPADIGYKALAVNLSDLAAMGAVPRWALVSLALPPEYPVSDAEALMSGLSELASAHGVAIAGGNLARSPSGLMVDITAGGEVASRKWLTRSGARPGDELWLSGTIGAARAGLEQLRAAPTSAAAADSADPCVARHRRPEPRVRLGVKLARSTAARAAMDVSDGLADAVRQLAGASGCGARIDAEALPIDEAARTWWTARAEDPVVAAIAGGEDYELLFAVAPRARGRFRHMRARVTTPNLTRIGTLTRTGACVLVRNGREAPWPEGFQHFKEAAAR